MPNSCDLPVIITGGGCSPVMPSRHGGPVTCSVDRVPASHAPRRARRSGRDGVDRVDVDGTGCGRAGLDPTGIASRIRRRRELAAAPHARADAAGVVVDPPAEQGSQTTEYALLLIVAATIVMLAVTWAKEGAIKGVLDGVVAQVLALFGIGGG